MFLRAVTSCRIIPVIQKEVAPNEEYEAGILTNAMECYIKFILFIFKYIFIDFLQRGKERDSDLEMSMREKHQPAASCTLPTGDVPATKVHALDWN